LYDIHNHVLPDIDDGSTGLRMSLRMLEQAIHQGITHVVCTPHANDRSGEQANTLFHQAFEKLSLEIQKRDLPIQIGLAAEIMFGAEIQKTLKFPFATYCGLGEYFLIEFSRETPFEIIMNVIRASRRWGKRPVIAHFERYRHACKLPTQVEEIKAAGGIITIDAGSPLGDFGRPTAKIAKNLLKWRVVDILASDAHRDETHGFCLQAGREAAASIVGEIEAARMTLDAPRRIWNGTSWTPSQQDN
jgi:protein-tyrosine phosphatase